MHAVVDHAFTTWNVWRLYADPPYWETAVAAWAGKYTEERVVRWPTTRTRKMADCIRAYQNAMIDKHLSHDGSEVFARHIANAYRRVLQIRDEQGQPLWTIQKERKDSPKKIDVGMAGALSWEARRDAITEGASNLFRSIYDERSGKAGQEVDRRMVRLPARGVDLLAALVGYGLVVGGVVMWSRPAAMVLAGVLLLAASLLRITE